jgi:hypothetical protein
LASEKLLNFNYQSKNLMPLDSYKYLLTNVINNLQEFKFKDQKYSSLICYSDKNKYLAPSIMSVNKKFTYENNVIMSMGLFYVVFLKKKIIVAKPIIDTFVLVDKNYNLISISNLDNNNLQDSNSQNISSKTCILNPIEKNKESNNDLSHNSLLEKTKESNKDQSLISLLEKTKESNNDLSHSSLLEKTKESNKDQSLISLLEKTQSNIDNSDSSFSIEETKNDFKEQNQIVKKMESESKLKKIKKYNKTNNLKNNSNLMNIDDFISGVFSKTLNENSINEILKSLSNK